MNTPNRWFRLYSETLNDPKVQRLSPTLFKTWINLLCLASTLGGKLPRSLDDIAFRLRISVQDAESQLDDLILAELIDIATDGTRQPHNWKIRQYVSDSSAKRVQKHRKNKRMTACNVTCNGSVTPPDSETDTEKDAETDQEGEKNSLASGSEVVPIDANLIRRVEGLGLDVDDLIAKTAKVTPRDPSAYFQSLARNSLRRRLPGLSDDVIGRGLSSDDAAYGALQNLLTIAETAHA